MDHYKTLGVNKSASADEIRKAYRKLSKQYHPDRNKDNPKAAEQFKQVQEAYDVLGDTEKRQQYDRFGTTFPQGARGASPGGGTPFNYSWSSGPGGEQIDLGDLFGAMGGFGGFGGGAGPRGQGTRGRRPAVRGHDIEAELTVPFLTAAIGGSVEVQLHKQGRLETLAIKVPAGVSPGQVIRLAGQGEASHFDGPPGDLLLKVRIEAHPYFRRDGNQLLVDIPLTPSEAALGAKVDVPTLTGGRVTLNVPPGTSSGAKLRLRGQGLLDPQTGQPGDQLAVAKIVVPKDLSETERLLYEQLRDQPRTDPRQGLWS